MNSEFVSTVKDDIDKECRVLLMSGAVDVDTLEKKGEVVLSKVIMAAALQNVADDYRGQIERLDLKSEVNDLRNF